MKVILALLGGLVVLSAAWAQKPTAAKGSNQKFDSLFERATFTEGDASLPYRLLKPEGYEKEGSQSYPLVVFLHGAGERGDNNESQLKHGVAEFVTDAARKDYPCFLVAPQCPVKRAWSDLSGGVKEDPKFSETPIKEETLLLDLIDSLSKEYRVDKDRIYVTGLSMGGFGTWNLVSRRPDLFAAAVPICGGGDPSQAPKLTKLPIWAFHGDADRAVPVERTRGMIAAIKEAGGSPKYTEYEGVGHDSWTQTYKDGAVIQWMFAQKKGSPAP